MCPPCNGFCVCVSGFDAFDNKGSSSSSPTGDTTHIQPNHHRRRRGRPLLVFHLRPANRYRIANTEYVSRQPLYPPLHHTLGPRLVHQHTRFQMADKGYVSSGSGNGRASGGEGNDGSP